MAPAITDADLALQFESLGDNCELGLVQRRLGQEPLGLLRFAGAPLRNLLRAMAARFAHIADPGHVRIQEENGEYMVKLTKYDFTYHANVKPGEIDPDALHQQQARTCAYLARKLIEDLETPSKIFVFRQNEPLSALDLVDLRIAIASYGPGVLLWVQEACPGHPPGTVEMADERLYVGYVRRLAEREAVPDLDLGSWLTILRLTHAMTTEAGAPARLPQVAKPLARPRTDVTFGAEGNAAALQGKGWSGAEAGYTWAVGERSELTLATPGEAGEYWLEMDVTPFVRPPLLPSQRLDVFVEGTFVQSFDPVPRGEIGCVVPAALVAGKATVQVLFGHPQAASPMLIAGEGDDRRLALSFARVALVCA
jgi:hypothetical protein